MGEVIKVGMADLKTAKAPNTLTTLGLGSCIGLTLYDPVTHIDNTIKRRNRILNQMKEDGKISAEVCKQAKEETITLNRPTSVKNNYVETYTYYCATRALMAQEGFEFKNTFQSATEKVR